MPALSAITEFALAARAHDDVLDLEALTVAVARIGNPGLDAAVVTAELDAMAARIADSVPAGAAPDRLAVALRRAIVTDLGFVGDPGRPAEPEDSYLDRVLQRKRGLPILLSVVWILLGQRLGLPIRGVNFPGHFLVCVDAPGARVFVDPFHGGAIRDGGDLLARLGVRGSERGLLEPCGVRPIVTRILLNLKNLWIDRREYVNALAVVDRILLVAGEQPQELRDRGLILLHLGRPREADRDFRRYLKVAPEAEDRVVIEGLLQKIQEA